MQGFWRVTIGTAVAVLLVAGPVSAACVQGDMAGTWRVYVIGAEVNDDPFWIFCTLRVRAGGSVRSGTECTYDDTSPVTITGGQLNVSSTCVVTGTVTTQLVGATTVRHATLDRGKTVLTGVGKSVNGSIGLITGTKQ